MSEKTYMDFQRMTHEGKYGVVYDYAVADDGDLYYASIVGSRQMCEGIAAALLDNGKRNTNAVYLTKPTDGSKCNLTLKGYASGHSPSLAGAEP